jgi:hypothetical protein
MRAARCHGLGAAGCVVVTAAAGVVVMVTINHLTYAVAKIARQMSR